MGGLVPGAGRRVIFAWTSSTPRPVASARAAVRDALTELGLCEEVVDDAVLAVSELAANATEHAAGPYEITVRWTERELICEVHDGDPTIPVIPAFPGGDPFAARPEDRGGGLGVLAARLAERGRGLHIVDHLTRGAWGFHRDGKGRKSVWMAVSTSSVATRPSSGAGG